MLAQVARRLAEVTSAADVLARLSGDKFALLAPLARLGQAHNLAADLLEKFHEPFTVAGESFFIKSSIGISFFPRDGHTLSELLRTADGAAYRAKRRGKSGFDYNESLQDNLNERFDVEYKLRDAIECDELELYYQPRSTWRKASSSGSRRLSASTIQSWAF